MTRVPLFTKTYRTLSAISGPLLVVERVTDVGYGEIVEVQTRAGEVRRGQVLEVDGNRVVVQMFASTGGMDIETTRAQFTGEVAQLGVSREMLGRMFNGSGQPIDGLPPLVPEQEYDITGLPINPFARAHPSECIQTGISAIDGLNTLVRGQKLPIFSCAGLPAAELAAQIVAQARVIGASDSTSEPFAVVFAAIGITHREATYFQSQFEASGAVDRTVSFINLANDPAVERILTPRLALTSAEYLAFAQDMHVLVVITDMLHYAESLREVAAAREEVPGRRGYPGYLYTDLATLYERAGRIKEKPGSITQLLILTMPDDDITHPVPDLTGYITEGQIVLSRDLHRQGIYPPIDVLPSLSRLMNAGIGADKTRQDHRNVADQLYALYAQGREVRRLLAIIGEAALSVEDRRSLAFADQFERRFLHQGHSNRSLAETLTMAWEVLGTVPAQELKRIRPDYIEKYYRQMA